MPGGFYRCSSVAVAQPLLVVQRACGDLLEVLVDGRGAHIHLGCQFLSAQCLAVVVPDPVHHAGDAEHLAVGGGALPQRGALVAGHGNHHPPGARRASGHAHLRRHSLRQPHAAPGPPLPNAALPATGPCRRHPGHDGLGHLFWAVAAAMVGWGALNAAHSRVLVRLAGQLLDHASTSAPLVGGAVLRVLSALIAGDGSRIRRERRE